MPKSMAKAIMSKLEVRYQKGFESRMVDDETEEILFDGEVLVTTSHDEDGWGGMRRVRETTRAVAERLGIPFKET